MEHNDVLSLEAARSRADEIARALRDGAAQAPAIEQAAARLASGGNEQAASIEQIRAGIEEMASGIEETGAALQTLQRSQQRVNDMAREVLSVDPATFKPPPEVVAEQAAGFVKAVAQVGTRLVMLIDCDRVIGEGKIHGT